jgi:hypothetical protein
MPGSSPFPRAVRSFGRGLLLVATTPLIVVGVPILLLLMWVAVVALGFQGPFVTMQLAFALPPLGTVGDTTIAGALSGGVGLAGILSAFGFLFFRAVLVSLLTTVLVERLRAGSVSGWALKRLLRVLPLAIAVNFMALFLLIIANIAAAFFGSGLQTLVSVAALAFGVYLTAYITTVAADEDRTQSDGLRRGVRVARQPGSNNLWIAALYVLVNFILLLLPLPGGLIGVNPSFGSWVVAIVVNLLHVAVLATFVYRYLAVAPLVDEAPPPRRQPPPRRR